MTIMTIDNKATSKKSLEKYIIDRNLYQTESDLWELVRDCMNEEAYLIRIEEDGKELLTARNWR